MGYRSQVAYTIRFRTEENYHLFILEAKANPVTAGCFGNDDGHWDEATCDDEHLRIDFHVRDVKWYPSYPDVKMHEGLLEQAQAWCDEADHVTAKETGEITLDLSNYRLGYAYVRIGEDDNDIETKYGGRAEYRWLSVSRQIEFD